MTITDEADLAFAGAAHQAEALRNGAVSARELTEIYLRRIEAIDPRLNSFRSVSGERALSEADACQERLRAGQSAPLLGVPVAVKDNVDVTGDPTRHGTPAEREPASADSEVVRRLRAAGAVILGKTTLPELALWPHQTESPATGPTRNPWNRERSTGGSSGGSAAAVAAGLAPLAHGSDGGASIRVPAACCGVFGLKPQRDRVPLSPDDDHWLGLTHFGPLARRVADAALFMDAAAEPLPGGGTWSEAVRPPRKPLRIAVSSKTPLPTRLQDAPRRALESTVALLEELGHSVEQCDPDYGELRPLITPRYVRGAWRDAQMLGDHAPLDKATRTLVRLGAFSGRASSWVRRREQARAARINRLFDDHDLLLMPVTAAQPPEIGRWVGKGGLRTFLESSPWIAYTPVWNFTGQPAASVPAGLDDEGMPTAVQIVAPPGGERALLELAAQLEEARPWAGRRPPV